MSKEYRYLQLAEHFRTQGPIQEGLTFDDVILLPGRSVVNSPDEVDTSSLLAPHIRLESPIMSANMDTVTGPEMAIAMALDGGIGALHRGMTIDQQAEAVQRVKYHQQYIIDQPPTLQPGETIGRAKELMERHNRGYVVILDPANGLHGIVTTRDLRMPGLQNETLLSHEIYTSAEQGLITAHPDISMEEAQYIMWQKRVEKLLLVDNEGNFAGVITDRDIREIQRYPKATKDPKGRLQVLGSVGVGPSAVDDALVLEAAGADGIIIDVLHGDTPRVLELTELIRNRLKDSVPLIVGNVATAEQTSDLAQAGANIIKVGWGPGGFCTTRIVTGTGSAQFRATIECAAEAHKHGVKIIADGGIRYPADMVKALYGGAAAIMVGTMLIGADESPGRLYVDENGARYKLGRGSASESASQDFARATGKKAAKRRAAQGVEGVRISSTGPVEGTIFKFMDGVRNGIAAVGASDIDSLQRVGRLERQSFSSLSEGQPHAKK